jgi:hypothetical protein
MNNQKIKYLDRIRTQSSYPWVRRIAGLVAFIFYTLGSISIVSSLMVAFTIGSLGGLTAVFGGLFGIFLFVLGAIIKETSIMVADIADSITDLNCRYELPE